MPNAPEAITTPILVLRRPVFDDAEAMFDGFTSNPEATRFMSWRTHATVDDTRAFLVRARAEWDRDGVGTYLIERDGLLVGSTGLHVEGPRRAETGYILRPDVWGRGVATEACRAMVDLAGALGFTRLAAHCYVGHLRSARVLEKAGMTREGLLCKHIVLPNLAPDPQDMQLFAKVW